MGMFDYVKCSHPLPGDPPQFVRDFGHQFQTKSLDCCLATYKITAEGRLVLDATLGGMTIDPEPLDFSGELSFYDSNSTGGGHGAVFTRRGEDSERVEYTAKFDRGNLVEIVEIDRTRTPALPESSRAISRRPTAEERAAIAARRAESLLGRTMYAVYVSSVGSGGADVEVVAEGKHDWVIRCPDDRLEVVPRGLRDSKIFDSKEEFERIKGIEGEAVEKLVEAIVREVRLADKVPTSRIPRTLAINIELRIKAHVGALLGVVPPRVVAAQYRERIERASEHEHDRDFVERSEKTGMPLVLNESWMSALGS